MYARYNALFNSCGTPSTGITDSTHFSCASLSHQPFVRRSIQSEEISPSDIQCLHDCKEKDAQCRYRCAPIREEFTPIPKKNSGLPLSSSFLAPQQQTPVQKEPPADPTNLLPVMDPRFNLREICKQCILLEDHLSHNEKRCTDCCIKHFLTIEALAEEAITLDKDKSLQTKIETLPGTIRRLQNQWFEDPDKNAHHVSQELRAIRKEYQIDNFDVVFKESCNSCSDGVCRVRRGDGN